MGLLIQSSFQWDGKKNKDGVKKGGWGNPTSGYMLAVARRRKKGT